MKSSLFYVLTFTVLLFISCSSNNFPVKFSYSPENPQPSSEIIVKYKSDSQAINNSNEVEMVVYSYSDDLENTEKVNLEKMGEGWIGKYTPKENIKGLIIKFNSENEIDNNNELGYTIKLNDESGNVLVGATAGLANVYSKYAGSIDLLAAKDSASKFFEMEFAKNPEQKRQFLLSYLNSFPRKQRKKVAVIEIPELEKNENLTQKDLETLATWFKNLREFEKADYYYDLVKEKYPKSKLIGSNYYTRFRNMLTIDKMMQVFNEFNSLNPESNYNNYMISTIINKYVSEKDYKNVQKMLNEYSQYTNSNIYNSVAWKLFETKSYLEKASDLCLDGIELAREEYESPTGEKPVYLDVNDWKESKKYALAMIIDTYGNIQNELNNKRVALMAFEEAVKLTNKEQSDINENYTALLFEMGENEKAKAFIEELIKDGKGSDKMRNILSDIFAKEGGSEDKFEEYIGKFDNEAKQKLTVKLKEEMINEPAPNFELLDLDGATVKLSDYKGKIVIVDFWATWCGPCLQSFPVMRKAVDKYADNPDVKFLFVNTKERVDDKKENAVDFMKKSQYPFHVLLDDQDEVVEKFKVQGIPTKFIIDGSGNIRFQSVGFSGVESEVLEELDQMISMSK